MYDPLRKLIITQVRNLNTSIGRPLDCPLKFESVKSGGSYMSANV